MSGSTWILLAVTTDPEQTGASWSPYLVGALIGVLSWFTFLFSNKPIGASTAYARVSGMIGKAVAPRHTMSLKYFQDNKPKIDWGVMLVIGVIIGAVLAAWTGNELLVRAVPPMWTERFGDEIAPRLIVACLGGALMAFGARLAGGCTSGHGISGSMQLSVSSWISLVGFFAGGVITAMLLFNT
ncbi:MAG: YeeE/YedE thiosulfate transporter family protein [Phycisphaerales bacterium]